MVPRIPRIGLTILQAGLLAAFLTNGVVVDNWVRSEYGGGSGPANPIGLNLAAISYFLDYSLGPDLSEALASAALATYSSHTRSSASKLATLEVALAKIKKHDYAAAEPLAKKAMAVYYNLGRRRHSHGSYKSQPLIALCSAYHREGQPELARQTIEYQISRIESQKLDLQHGDKACDYIRIAEVYSCAVDVNYALGYYSDAEQYAKKVLLYSHMSGRPVEDHFANYSPEWDVAASLVKQEKFEQALPYALAYQRQSLHSSGNDLSKIMVALIWQKMGNEERSLAAFSTVECQALEAKLLKSKQGFGDYSFYLDLIDARGRHDDAVKYMQQVANSCSTQFDYDYDRYKTKTRLAQYLLNAGQPRLAAAILERTMKKREAVIGAWSLDMAKSYGLLAEAQLKLGKKTEAIDSLERALKIEKLTVGQTSPLFVKHSELLAYAKGPSEMRCRLLSIN